MHLMIISLNILSYGLVYQFFVFKLFYALDNNHITTTYNTINCFEGIYKQQKLECSVLI